VTIFLSVSSQTINPGTNIMISRNFLKSAFAATLTASLMTGFAAHADNNEIIERVKPVGQLIVVEGTAAASPAAATDAVPAAEAAPATADAGKATYDTACFACHGTGAAGAPILGNKEAWTPRVGKGIDTLYSNAINGINAMPPKGGAVSLSDDQVKAVVDYMVGQSS
jgi:cytochrome c5